MLLTIIKNYNSYYSVYILYLKQLLLFLSDREKDSCVLRLILNKLSSHKCLVLYFPWSTPRAPPLSPSTPLQKGVNQDLIE